MNLRAFFGNTQSPETQRPHTEDSPKKGLPKLELDLFTERKILLWHTENRPHEVTEELKSHLKELNERMSSLGLTEEDYKKFLMEGDSLTH